MTLARLQSCDWLLVMWTFQGCHLVDRMNLILPVKAGLCRPGEPSLSEVVKGSLPYQAPSGCWIKSPAVQDGNKAEELWWTVAAVEEPGLSHEAPCGSFIQASPPD